MKNIFRVKKALSEYLKSFTMTLARFSSLTKEGDIPYLVCLQV
jgi:hypothetical protein